MARLFYLLLIFGFINVSCSEEELSPSETLIGKWQLVSLQRLDTTFFNSSYAQGYVSEKIEYNNDPLLISYDTLGYFKDEYSSPLIFKSSHFEENYNLIFYLEIFRDGTTEITEEYKDLNNNVVLSWQYPNNWWRIEKGIDNYEFQFTLEWQTNSLTYPSKIFRNIYGLYILEENIKNNQFTGFDEYSIDDDRIMTYTFKKI